MLEMNRPNIRFKNDSGTEYPLYSLTSFSEVLSIERGSSPRPIQKYLTNDADGLNWIKIGDAPVNGTRITAVKEKIKKSGLSKTRFVKKGDLILSNSMSFGRPYLLAVDGCIHDGWLLIRNSRNKFIVEFLLYLLSSPNILRQYKSLAGAGVVTNLNKELVSKVILAIPSLEEQQKIASFFSTLDQKIELNERKLEALEKLKKGVMQKIFNREIRFKKNGEDFPKWNKVKIQEMGEIRTGTTPKNNQEGVYGGPHYWVTPTDIKSKEIYQTNKTLTDSGLQSGRVIPANSVLVTCIASIGKNAILRRKGSCNQQINAITPNQNFNVDFVYYAITHAEPILHRLAGQGGMEIINKRDFSEVELFVPCLEEQNAIAAFLSSLDRKIQISSERINNLNSLKQGFMQQMFV